MSETSKPSGPDLSEGIEDSAVAEGVPLLGHVGDEAVMIVRTQGELFAVGATCSHYGGPLSEGLIVGDTVHCPWHHARFCLRTGAVEAAPALNPVACYRVEKLGTRLRVGARVAPMAPAPWTGEAREIVIIGAGAAGHAAAEALRRRGYPGRLTLIGRDPAAPYDRPNLSKDFLAGTAPEEWMSLRPPSFYAEQGIALETGAEVARIDPAARAVELHDGRRLAFDRLLLATGADPVRLPVPGADAPHVHLLRTLEDCRRLIAACAGARRVALVGSGFIGLEAAAALRARGLDVAVVSPDAAPLVRVVGEEVGAFLRGLHEEHGVTFHLGEAVTAIEPAAVVTASGKRIAADLVLVAIGVRPAITLAQQCGVAVAPEGGILVDECLETNLPGIFAAGDVARFPDPRSGQTIRVEHWVVAQRMGAAAAANMLGARQAFTAVPFFWSVHYDVTLSYVGHADGSARITVDGDLPGRACEVRYEQGGRLAAVLTIGRDRASLEAERALEIA